MQSLLILFMKCIQFKKILLLRLHATGGVETIETPLIFILWTDICYPYVNS